jgi:hypothetical protein
MEKDSPKRLQQAGKLGEALDYYVAEYVKALTGKDRYLSGLLMDEIAQTILLGLHEEYVTRKILSDKIRKEILGPLAPEWKKEVDDDILIEMNKRYPSPNEARNTTGSRVPH